MKLRKPKPSRYNARIDILDTAKRLVTGDRNAAHGPPEQDFQRTADAMTAIYAGKLRPGERFQTWDVACLVALVKLSRIQQSPRNRDNWVDLAGYAACGWECVTRSQERPAHASRRIRGH